MIKAKELSETNHPHFTIVIANKQNKGRGRLDRNWISNDGGLYFTIILRPNITIEKAALINFAASLVLTKVLRKLSFKAFTKWPNDILINEKKVAGILSEAKIKSNKINYINIGIGININNDNNLINNSLMRQKSISLKEIKGEKINKTIILKNFLEEFEHYINENNLSNIVDEWKKYSINFGRYVEVITLKEKILGKTVDVQNNGSLIILSKGKIKKNRLRRLLFYK